MIILVFFLSYWLGLSFRYSLVIIGTLYGILLTFAYRRFSRTAALIAILFFLGGTGMSFVRFSSDQSTYTGVVYECKDNYFLFNSRMERLYVYEKDNDREVGDVLTISGVKKELTFATLESQFDFQDYLSKKGVYKRLYADEIEVKFRNPARLRQYRNSFLSNFSSETGALVGGILFSEYDQSELTSLMKELHLNRFLSASGFYIHLYISLFTYVFQHFIRKKWAKLLSLGFLGTYLVLSFPRLTVMRVILVSLVGWFNEFVVPKEKKLHRFDVLGISGFLLLLLDYHFAYQDSFILGFTIPIAFYLCGTIAARFKKKFRKGVSLALFLPFFVPFEISYNHEISVFGFLTQLLFTPFFLIIGGLSVLALYGLPIYGAVNYVADMTLTWMKVISPINITIYASPLSDYAFALYGTAYFFFVYFLSFDFTVFRNLSFGVMTAVLASSVLPITNYVTSEVCFINVGQGDSCLIRKGDTAVLIDTGGSIYRDIATECLIPYFKSKHIYDIDLVITTHNDYDHSGALESLMKNFTVRDYISGYEDFPVTIGGIRFTNYNNHIDEAKDENSTSLVIGFHLINMDFLIMGDAPIAIEKDIVSEYNSVPCDILKAGHHGSNTSTCDEFVKFISPSEAVISVGKYNSYGHPHQSVLETLVKYGIEIHRTDEEGTIVYRNYIFM